MNNDFLVKVESLQEEIAKLEKQYQLIQQLQRETAVEQEKITEQNKTIKGQIAYLKDTQEKVNRKEADLNEREKQIVIKEKSIINANRLLDEKLLDFRKKTIAQDVAEKKLQKDLEDYHARKKLIDQQALINQKMEETEVLRKSKLKAREDQLDRELDRLKNLQV